MLSDAKSRREGLERLRDRIAREIDEGVDSKDLAALALRYQSVIAELDALEPSGGVSISDELANRRAVKDAAAG